MSNKSYLALVLDLLVRAQKLGLTVERDMSTDSTLPENGNFVFVRVGGGTAAAIIPMHAGGVKWIDSHIDWKGKTGYVPLERANGAVLCRIDPKGVDFDAYLKSLSGASKRDRKGSSQTTAKQSMDELKATLKALGMPASQADAVVATTSEQIAEVLVAQHQYDVSEEDAEETGTFSES